MNDIIQAHASLRYTKERQDPALKYIKKKKTYCEHDNRERCYQITVSDNIKLLYCDAENQFKILLEIDGYFMECILRTPHMMNRRDNQNPIDLAKVKWKDMIQHKAYTYSIRDKLYRTKHTINEVKLPSCKCLLGRERIDVEGYVKLSLERKIEVMNHWRDFDLYEELRLARDILDTPLQTYNQVMITNALERNARIHRLSINKI